jgi:hypothetical protein
MTLHSRCHAQRKIISCLQSTTELIALQVASVGKGRIEFDYTPTANMPCHATGAAYCGGALLHFPSAGPASPCISSTYCLCKWQLCHEDRALPVLLLETL